MPTLKIPGAAYSSNCRLNSTSVTTMKKISVLSGPPKFKLHAVQGSAVVPGASKYREYRESFTHFRNYTSV